MAISRELPSIVYYATLTGDRSLIIAAVKKKENNSIASISLHNYNNDRSFSLMCEFIVDSQKQLVRCGNHTLNRTYGFINYANNRRDILDDKSQLMARMHLYNINPGFQSSLIKVFRCVVQKNKGAASITGEKIVTVERNSLHSSIYRLMFLRMNDAGVLNRMDVRLKALITGHSIYVLVSKYDCQERGDLQTVNNMRDIDFSGIHMVY